MLKLLIVKNIALSASVELEFAPGLNLLTGETGAGKSLVVDALGLVLGARGDAELIRTGEKTATVEAVFDVPGIGALLEARGLPVDGDEVILRRELGAAGRSRAAVNGALVPVATLRELAPALAAIHGQNEHRDLLDEDSHGEFLDEFAGLLAERAALGDAYRDLRAAEAELEATTAGERGLADRREFLSFQLTEIDRAALEPGEDEILAAERVVQANSGRLAGLSSEAYAALYEDEGAVLEKLAAIYRKVQELAALDPRFAPHLESRAAVTASLDELALFLRDYKDTLGADPARLDAIESRLALIDRLKKRHGGSLVAVLEFAERTRDELGLSRSPEETLALLEKRVSDGRQRYRALAVALSAKRRKAALVLEKRVLRELGELAMEKTAFTVALSSSNEPELWGATGFDRPQFCISANVGEESRPLARVASGGELSRILLALRTVEAGRKNRATAVFDEVDSGIGGRVAEVVGRKLRAVAQYRQVLCVTHLAAVASQADAHFVVRKRVASGRTLSEVAELDAAGRIEEIARMMGGETITATSRKHAREMLEHAQAKPRVKAGE